MQILTLRPRTGRVVLLPAYLGLALVVPIPGYGPVAVERTTWGRIKALYTSP